MLCMPNTLSFPLHLHYHLQYIKVKFVGHPDRPLSWWLFYTCLTHKHITSHFCVFFPLWLRALCRWWGRACGWSRKPRYWAWHWAGWRFVTLMMDCISVCYAYVLYNASTLRVTAVICFLCHRGHPFRCRSWSSLAACWRSWASSSRHWEAREPTGSFQNRYALM